MGVEMDILHIIVLVLLIVSIVLAVIYREKSPIYYAVLSAVVLYVLSGFIK